MLLLTTESGRCLLAAAQIVLEVRGTTKRNADGVLGVLQAVRRSVVEECGLCPTRVVRVKITLDRRKYRWRLLAVSRHNDELRVAFLVVVCMGVAEP